MIDLRVLKDRNLALSSLHMLVFGAVLYGTTALLPLMLQTQFGYTAMQSGMALSPGGLVVAVLMPLVGFLVTRVDPRWMILFGIAVISASLLQMASFSPQVDFRTVVLARMLQGFGLAFIFVPINTIAYANVAAIERNAASSLVNIARNIGGSIGIGLISAFVSRATQSHRTAMVAHTTPYDRGYDLEAAALQARLLPQVGDPERTRLLAHRLLDAQVDHQAGILAYLDQFRFLAIAFLVLVPIVIAMRSRRAQHVELAAE